MASRSTQTSARGEAAVRAARPAEVGGVTARAGACTAAPHPVVSAPVGTTRAAARHPVVSAPVGTTRTAARQPVASAQAGATRAVASRARRRVGAPIQVAEAPVAPAPLQPAEARVPPPEDP